LVISLPRCRFWDRPLRCLPSLLLVYPLSMCCIGILSTSTALIFQPGISKCHHTRLKPSFGSRRCANEVPICLLPPSHVPPENPNLHASPTWGHATLP
jgi:hypothetical protein